MPNSDRRIFLKSTSSAVLLGVMPVINVTNLHANTATQWSFDDIRAQFSRFCDTVIPKDESSSASDLSLDVALHKDLAKNIHFQVWPVEFCQWLVEFSNKNLGKDFKLLSNKEFESAVKVFANDSEHYLYSGFEYSRQYLMEAYYSNAESWKGIKAYHAPQPLGYLDFEQTISSKL